MDHPSLTDLQRTAEELLGRDLAHSTEHTYASALARWQRFCTHRGLAQELADPLLVAAFTVDRLRAGTIARPATIKQDLSGLTWVARQDGTHLDIDGIASAVIRAWFRQHPPAPRRPAPVIALWALLATARHLRTSATTPAARWRGLRNCTALLVGYQAALRPSELLSLRVDNVAMGDDLTSLTIRDAKSGALQQVEIPSSGLAAAALRAWLAQLDRRAGALFPSRRGAPEIPLSPEALLSAWRAAAESLRFGTDLTLRSLRRTWATHAYLEGVPLDAIGAHLRHSTLEVSELYVNDLQLAGLNDDWARSFTAVHRPTTDAQPIWGSDPSLGVPHTRWEPSNVPLTALKAEAVRLAKLGAAHIQPATDEQTRSALRAWRRHVEHVGAEHSETPTEDDLLAFVAALRRAAYAPNTVSNHLAGLRRWILQRDPTSYPDFGPAHDALDAYRREQAGRHSTRQAPVIDERTIAQLLHSVEPDDLNLCIAAVRRAAAGAGYTELRPVKGKQTRFCSWTREDLTLTDTTAVIDGFRFPLNATDPSACPVRALLSRASVTAPGHPLFPRAHLQGGRELLQRYGSHIEDWPDHAFAECVRLAAHGLRQYERDRLTITLLYGAAWRVSDLRRARIEHLENVEAGVLVPLPSAKYNPNGQHIDVALLERRDDALCPVAQLHRFLAVWPFEEGPLVAPVRVAEWPQTGPPRPVNTREIARCLTDMRDSSGIDIPITTHSFRRTRASVEYATHGDKLRVKRTLRHRNWRYVDDYIEQLDVWRHNPTIGIADGA